jgi:Carboxypeptidase regulatory-like domain
LRQSPRTLPLLVSARPATLLLLVLNALAPTPALRAQSARVAEEIGITGYVIAPDGAPVIEGTVVAQLDASRATASIDRTGRFRVVPTRSGLHQIVVSAPGLAPYRLTVTVPPSRSLRLPVIHLAPGGYFRVHLVSPAGEAITAPQLRLRVFDLSGNSIPDALSDRIDSEGAVVIGPLPQGIVTMAVDNRFFAQTRLPDLKFDGAARLADGGTIVIQQPGEVLNVDLVDGTGAPVPDHEVNLEDTLPRSPLAFRPVWTNRQGRATFDRLAPGRYRVSTTAVERCANQAFLTAERVVGLSGTGTAETRLIVGGRASFHVVLPLLPASGLSISAAPNVSPSQLPSTFAPRSASSGCRGTTDTDGRVTLTNFPPGPAHVDVHNTNSTFVRQVDVPPDGKEITVAIPDGFLPVRVVNALTNRPVPGASIAWSANGARVEATATATGEALLEGVGMAGGTLAVSARGYERAEESLAEPPGSLHDIALTPVAPSTTLRPRVITASGEPLPNAVLELISANPADVRRVATTDAKGVAAFADVPSGSLQLIASADGFVTSKMRIGEDRTAEIVLTLSQGYRVLASVELPAAEGPQLVRVVSDDLVSMEEVLDTASDRGFEPPASLSLGPLAPGAYVIELRGTGGRRQERLRIVDRDVNVTFR